jgi:hypothetical protein
MYEKTIFKKLREHYYTLPFITISLCIILQNYSFWEDEALYALFVQNLTKDFSYYPLIYGNFYNPTLVVAKWVLLPYFFASLISKNEIVFRSVSLIFGIFTLLLTKKILKCVYGKINSIFLVFLSLFPPLILASTENIPIILLLTFTLGFLLVILLYQKKKITFKKTILLIILFSLSSPFLSFTFLLTTFFLLFLDKRKWLKLFCIILPIFIFLVSVNIIYFHFSIKDFSGIFQSFINNYVNNVNFLKFHIHFFNLIQLFVNYFSFYFYLPLFLLPLLFKEIKRKKEILIMFVSFFISLTFVALFTEKLYTYPNRGLVILSYFYLLLVYYPENKKFRKIYFLVLFFIIFLFLIHLIPFISSYKLYFQNNSLFFKSVNEQENEKWVCEDCEKRLKINSTSKCFLIKIPELTIFTLTFFDLRCYGDYPIPFKACRTENQIVSIKFDSSYNLSSYTLYLYLIKNSSLFLPPCPNFQENCEEVEYEEETKPSSTQKFLNEKIFGFKQHPLFHEDFNWRELTNFIYNNIKEEKKVVGKYIQFYVSLPAPLIFYLQDKNLSINFEFKDLHKKFNFSSLFTNWYGEQWFILDNSRYWWQLEKNEKDLLEEKCEKLFFPKMFIYRCKIEA